MVLLSCGSWLTKISADEIPPSRKVVPAEFAGSSEEATQSDLDLSIDFGAGSLKPSEYLKSSDEPVKQPLLAPSNPVVEETEIPPAPESPALVPDVSASRIPESGQEVDLQPPTVDEVIEEEAPNWVNPLVDNHAFLWHEVKSDVEILPRGSSGFGMTSLTFSGVSFGDDGPIWGGGKFDWHFLSGPRHVDVRSQTYDFAYEVNFATQLNQTWGLHLMLTPTLSTDMDNKTSDVFRFIGGGLVSHQSSEGIVWLGGVMFLDRPDIPVIPIGGLRIYDGNVELDLVIPRPRIAWKNSTDEEGDEHWFYLAGELGGGSWAIERELNRKDVLSYRDYRLVAGIESKSIDGGRSVAEVGWVFHRKLHFKRFGGSTDIGDTAIIRCGLTY